MKGNGTIRKCKSTEMFLKIKMFIYLLYICMNLVNKLN